LAWIAHDVCTKDARNIFQCPSLLYVPKCSYTSIQFHYSIPCNVKISYTSEILLHVAVTSVNCSHFSYCTTTTLLMSSPPLLWTSCICFFLGGNRALLCSAEVGTWQRWDWMVTSLLLVVGDRHQKIPAVSPSLYFKLWESPVKIKVHALRLRGSFQFWINWVSSSMSNLTIQLNLIFYGVIFCISLRCLHFLLLYLDTSKYATNLSQAA